jgi:hypothetical protein
LTYLVISQNLLETIPEGIGEYWTAPHTDTAFHLLFSRALERTLYLFGPLCSMRAM